LFGVPPLGGLLFQDLHETLLFASAKSTQTRELTAIQRSRRGNSGIGSHERDNGSDQTA
jgi:hypothetical protein